MHSKIVIVQLTVKYNWKQNIPLQIYLRWQIWAILMYTNGEFWSRFHQPIGENLSQAPSSGFPLIKMHTMLHNQNWIHPRAARVFPESELRPELWLNLRNNGPAAAN